jgi:hypothetical protein
MRTPETVERFNNILADGQHAVLTGMLHRPRQLDRWAKASGLWAVRVDALRFAVERDMGHALDERDQRSLAIYHAAIPGGIVDTVSLSPELRKDFQVWLEEEMHIRVVVHWGLERYLFLVWKE